MKVLLINLPLRLNAPPEAFPTGLGIIAKVLYTEGHDVRILDVNALRYTKEQVSEWLSFYNDVDVVGISGLITTYGYQKLLISEIKKRIPKADVISGGGCASSAPHILMANTPVDILVIGEGEDTMRELMVRLSKKESLAGLTGIWYREEDGLIIKNPPRNLNKDLDLFPFPAYELFPTELYLQYRDSNPFEYHRVLTMITSRGCPYDCNFCYHIFKHRSYRMRTVDNVMKEIEMVANLYNVEFIRFVDDNLTVNKGHLLDFCSKIKKFNIGWSCSGRVDTCDDERLSAMRDANCKSILLGIESASEKILKNMNKKITPQAAEKAILNVRRHNILARTPFIFGYPGEDHQSIRETLNFKKKLNLKVGDYFINPYPGTLLYKELLQMGKINNEEEFILKLDDAGKFTINLTKFSDEELFRLKYKAESSLMINNYLKDPRKLLYVLVNFKLKKILTLILNLFNSALDPSNRMKIS